jgi:hypothetical protein
MAEAVAGLRFVLQTIGFNPAKTGSIMEAGLSEFEDFRYLVEKDIRDMAEEFGKRTMVQGRIVFGLGRTKKLTGVMHWVQDRFRANNAPEHNDFNEPALFEALSLTQIRKSDFTWWIQIPRRPTQTSLRMNISGRNGRSHLLIIYRSFLA